MISLYHSLAYFRTTPSNLVTIKWWIYLCHPFAYPRTGVALSPFSVALLMLQGRMTNYFPVLKIGKDSIGNFKFPI